MGDTIFFQKQEQMNLLKQALHWQSFVIKMGISCVVTIALAISAALSGVNDWSALSRTQQVIIVCGVIGVAGNNIISLIDKGFSEKLNGKNGNGNGNGNYSPTPTQSVGSSIGDKK